MSDGVGSGPDEIIARVAVSGAVEVTRLGLGCAPLGNLYTAISDADARATVDAAWDAGVRLFDAAPLYGHGLSERRLGAALAGRPRDEFVVSTKVGRLLRPASGPVDTIFVVPTDVEPVWDFSRDGVLRSIEESLERLGLDRLDIVYVHDPDDHEADALDHAIPTLCALRDEGVIGAVGVGMNQWEMPLRFVERTDLDVVLLAGRWTLLDRSAGEQFLPACVERGVAVVAGGVFNSGVLAAAAPADGTFDYAPASEGVVAEVGRLRDVCAAHGVELPAAALQFVLRSAGITAVVVGARSAAEITADVAWAASVLPPELWTALDA